MSPVQTGGLLQLAIEASPNGILLIDSRGTIALVNRSAEHQFGYTRQELLGRRVDDLLPDALDAVRAAQAEAIAIALNSDAPETPAIAKACRKDGSRFELEVRLKPIRTSELTCVLATLIDRDDDHAEPAARGDSREERAAFEQIVVELTNDLLNLPDDDQAVAIERGLHRACDWLGLDGAAFSQLSPDGARAEIAGWGGVPHSRRSWPPERSLYPHLTQRTLAGNLVSIGSASDIVDDEDRRSFQSADLRSALIAPLHVGGLVVGSICLVSSRVERRWQDEDIKRIGLLSGILDQVLERRQREESLRSALAEVRSLKEELQTENPGLRKVRRGR